MPAKPRIIGIVGFILLRLARLWHFFYWRKRQAKCSHIKGFDISYELINSALYQRKWYGNCPDCRLEFTDFARDGLERKIFNHLYLKSARCAVTMIQAGKIVRPNGQPGGFGRPFGNGGFPRNGGFQNARQDETP